MSLTLIALGPVLIVCVCGWVCMCGPDDVSLYLSWPFVNNEATSNHPAIPEPKPKSPPEFDNGSPTNCGLERDRSEDLPVWHIPRLCVSV